MQLADFRKEDGREGKGSVSRCSRHQNITAALEGTPVSDGRVFPFPAQTTADRTDNGNNADRRQEGGGPR